MTSQPVTREAWLQRAIEAFRGRFVEVGMPLPDKIHVSVGFGFGTKAESKDILGQTWAQRASDDSVNHVFVSPEMGDTAAVLGCLLHELIHVADDCVNGHKGQFAEAAVRFGFEGSLLTLNPSVALTMELVTMADTLGEYPHGALSAASLMRTKRIPKAVPVGTPAEPKGKISSGPATQTTRMIKMSCTASDCACGGYVIRTTAKWIAIGAPSCPMGAVMVQV